VEVERKIGILLPSSNMVIEPEFYRTVPSGVTVHSTRLFLTEVKYDAWMTMNQEIEKASGYLSTAEVNVILFACTGASFAKPGYDREIVDRIRKTTGLKATTTSTSVLEALREFNAKKISLATPYPKEVNGIAKTFLESHGIEVITEKGLGIVSSAEIGKLSPAAAYQLAMEVDRPEAEAILLSCTNLRTFDVLEELEQSIGKPVISSNQASLWNSLKILGTGLPIRGYGALLERI
jgi:maleate cis-trans isomerase